MLGGIEEESMNWFEENGERGMGNLGNDER